MPLVTRFSRAHRPAWSNTLLVEGTLPGATVVARTIGPRPRDIAKEIASGGRDRLSLWSGAKLQEEDRILVRQVLDAKLSAWTPDHLGVPVGKVPTEHGALAPLAFKSRVWECGARVWVKGAVPGAEVSIAGPGGVLASGRATEGGDARLPLAASLPGSGQSIKAHQEAPAGFPFLSGVPTTTSKQVEKLPIGSGEKLPAPTLDGSPPKGCDPSILVASVFDGAEVTVLRRSDGSSETSTFDYDRLNFIFASPLSNGGDQLEITQAITRYRPLLPSDRLRVDVLPAAKPGTPALLPPCADSVDVFVDNLEPRALVTLTYKNQNYRGMVPSSASSCVFRLAPLAANETITARQGKCGLPSDEGTVAVAGVSLIFTLAPDVVDPLVGCARVVRVTAIPGAYVQV